MLPDEKEWAAVNQLLKQQGLSQITILNEINVNDYVWLTLEASKSLRLTIQTLIDDCQRKQILVRELMTTNADLRDQLKCQALRIDEHEHIIEQMKSILNSHTSHMKNKSNPIDLIHYEDEFLLPRVDLKNNNDFINKEEGVNYTHRISKLNVIGKTLSDSETQLKNSNDQRKYKNKIEKLQLEIKALKREQKYDVTMTTKHISDLFKELEVDDMSSALKKIRSNVNRLHNYDSIKQFINDVNDIVQNNVDGNISNKHIFTCDKNLCNLKSIISQWANQMASIPELTNQLNTLLLTLFPHKIIHPIDPASSIQQIIDSLTDLPVLKIDHNANMAPVKDEKVSVESLHSMVEYVQMLFGIKSIRGVYAGMSGVYRRLSEQENAMKQLRSILSLDDKAMCSKLVAAVTDLCRRDNTRDNRFEKELLELEEVVEKQEEYISIFGMLVTDLQTLLQVQSPDHILPEVTRLVKSQKEITVY